MGRADRAAVVGGLAYLLGTSLGVTMPLARRLPALLVATLALLCAPAPASADDEDDFNTTWFGARVGVWYRPSIDMKVQVSGTSATALGFTGLLGSRIDIQDDLGVRENATSEYSFRQGILEAEAFVDTRWASVSAWAIPPYEYRGETVVQRTVSFGGAQFSASTPVESKFRQFHWGVDLRINLINNEYIRLSPVIAARVLAVDWEMRAPQLNLKGDTSDVDSPLKYDDAAIIPYPEVGLEARLGLRRWFEVDVKLTGMALGYFGVEGSTFAFEAGVTAYPIPYLGVRLGMRYFDFQIESKSSDAREQFDFDTQFLGANISLIVRFG